MDSPPYVGVPAPILKELMIGFQVHMDLQQFLRKGQDYMEQETEIKKQEEENRQYWTNESENIHQEMYDLNQER